MKADDDLARGEAEAALRFELEVRHLTDAVYQHWSAAPAEVREYAARAEAARYVWRDAVLRGMAGRARRLRLDLLGEDSDPQ